VTLLVHGLVRYRKGCRCFSCRLAKADYERRRLAAELPGYIDADRAREHLAALRRAGFGLRRICAETGLSRSALQRLSWQATVHRTTEARLLAMPAGEAPKPSRFVAATGTHRRVQAMCTLGWSPRAQAQMAGLGPTASNRMLMVEQVQPRTAEQIRRLYDKLSMEPAPPSRAATRARGRALSGLFFPPLAWDDEVIDDADALPCLLPPVEPVDRDLELLVQHVVAGHLVEVTRPARVEIVRRLPGTPRRRVAELARCTPDYVDLLRRQEASC
jgi:lambda repressor-like predicted transcriptional regulator